MSLDSNKFTERFAGQTKVTQLGAGSMLPSINTTKTTPKSLILFLAGRLY